MAYQIGNYALVANGVDNSPETMQEMLIPFAYHTQQYDKAMGDYDQLYSQGNALAYLKDLPDGSRAKGIYNRYMDDLKEAVKGLDSGYISRNALSRMKRRYSGEIGQLDMAVKNRQEDMTLRMKQKASDPTTLYEKKGVDDIDSYLDGQRHYGETYSGAQLAREASDAVKGLAQRFNGLSVGKIDDYTNALITKYGIDPEKVARYVQNPTADNQERLLALIGEGILSTSGIRSWGNTDAEKKAREFIASGMWSAVGKSQVQPFENYDERQRRQLEDKATLAGLNGNGSGNNLHANPVALRSQQELDENNKRIEDGVRDGYLRKMPNGEYQITGKGVAAVKMAGGYDFENVARQALNGEAYKDLKKAIGKDLRPTKNTMQYLSRKGGSEKVRAQARTMLSVADRKFAASDQSKSPEGNRERQKDYDFGDWWGKNVGGVRYGEKGEVGVETPNMNLSRWLNTHKAGSYDTWHSTGWDVQLGGTYAKEVGKQVKAAAPNNELTVAEFGGRGGWNKSKTIKATKLERYDPVKMTATRWGNTVTFFKDGYEPVTVLMPQGGLNQTAETNLMAATQMASDLAEVANQQYRPVFDAYGNVKKDKDGNIIYDKSRKLTDDNKTWIEGQINDLQNQIYWHAHHIVVPEKTKEEEVTARY